MWFFLLEFLKYGFFLMENLKNRVKWKKVMWFFHLEPTIWETPTEA
jgi:hypothetical protein